MLRAVLVVALAMPLAACLRPPVQKAFAQCRAAGAKPGAAGRDLGGYISDCMAAKGYEVAAGECSTRPDAELLQRCYQPMRRGP